MVIIKKIERECRTSKSMGDVGICSKEKSDNPVKTQKDHRMWAN